MLYSTTVIFHMSHHLSCIVKSFLFCLPSNSHISELASQLCVTLFGDPYFVQPTELKFRVSFEIPSQWGIYFINCNGFSLWNTPEKISFPHLEMPTSGWDLIHGLSCQPFQNDFPQFQSCWTLWPSHKMCNHSIWIVPVLPGFLPLLMWQRLLASFPKD